MKLIVFETNALRFTDWAAARGRRTQAKGASIVHETVYEERFLAQLLMQIAGADIVVMRDCVGGAPAGKGRPLYYFLAPLR